MENSSPFKNTNFLYIKKNMLTKQVVTKEEEKKKKNPQMNQTPKSEFHFMIKKRTMKEHEKGRKPNKQNLKPN